MHIQDIKHSIMTLYTNGFNDPYSHVVKIALAEKCLDFDEQLIQDNMEILRKLNPYCYTPTFVDRELILYNANIIEVIIILGYNIL